MKTQQLVEVQYASHRFSVLLYSSHVDVFPLHNPSEYGGAAHALIQFLSLVHEICVSYRYTSGFVE